MSFKPYFHSSSFNRTLSSVCLIHMKQSVTKKVGSVVLGIISSMITLFMGSLVCKPNGGEDTRIVSIWSVGNVGYDSCKLLDLTVFLIGILCSHALDSSIEHTSTLWKEGSQGGHGDACGSIFLLISLIISNQTSHQVTKH